MLFAELVEDDGAGGGLVAQGFAADAALVLADDLGRKAVRIGAEGIGDDEAHHLPMPGDRVLAVADLAHAAVGRRRRVTRGRLRQRVQQAKARQGRQNGMVRLQDVAEGVGALVAEVGRVGELTDAEGVADDDDGALHGAILCGVRRPCRRRRHCSSKSTTVFAPSFTRIFFAGGSADWKMTMITEPEVRLSHATGIGRTAFIGPSWLAIDFPLSSTHSIGGAGCSAIGFDSASASAKVSFPVRSVMTWRVPPSVRRTNLFTHAACANEGARARTRSNGRGRTPPF